MPKSNLQFFHDFLISEGFQRITSKDKDFRYEGNITVSGFTFGIKIIFNCPDFIELPEISVSSWPKDLPNRLPHQHDKGLCYLDEESVVLDRYDPIGSFNIIFYQVKSLLNSFLPKNEDALKFEYADEFTAYWRGKFDVYVRSFDQDTTVSFIEIENKLNPDTPLTNNIELIVHKNDGVQLEHWLDKRGSSLSTVVEWAKVAHVKVKKRSIIPSGLNWPPQSTNDLLNWLKLIDEGAFNSLVQKMEHVLKEKSSVFIILSTQSGHVGAYIKYDKNLTNHIKRNLKKTRKNGKQSMYQVLISKQATSVETFDRCNVFDATDKHITTRNHENKESLIGKKIAIIGCGTIGGYSALLLNQAGAGVQNKKGRGLLHLYDSDTLSADNIGRHILDSSYIGYNKANALKHLLTSRCFSEKISISGFPNKISPSDVSSIEKYDLVLDLTGNVSFSTALNHYLYEQKIITPILYSSIFLGGKAVRAFLDDRTGACYRCHRINNNGKFEYRFRLLKKGQPIPKPIKRECSFSYFPHSSSASNASAALVQQLTLDFFIGNPSPRFRHISLTKDIIHTKTQDLKKLRDCPCCSI